MACAVQHSKDALASEAMPTSAHTVALPIVFPNPVTISQKMEQVFEKLKAKPVIKRLQELGYNEVYAQKACLLYCAQKKNNALVETSALLNWISFEAKPEDIEKPITLADLLEHLDIEGAVQKLSKQVPGVSPQTVELAATFSLGDVAAAQQLLTAPVQGSALNAWDGQAETCLNNIWHYDGTVSSMPQISAHSQPLPIKQTPHLVPQQQSQAQQQAAAMVMGAVDAAQLQAAAALMISAACTSEPTAPATPPSAPSTPSAPHSPARTVSPKVKSTVYSGRKRSSSSTTSSLSSTSIMNGPTFSIPTTHSFQSMGCTSSSSSSSSSNSSSGGANVLRLGLGTGTGGASPVRVFGAPNLGVVTDQQESAEWEAEKKGLMGQVSELQKHKEWADSRIRDLIRKACEAEKPLAEENRGLREELAKCQEDQASLGGRVRELEDSLARLKEGCFREAAARRDVERRVAEAQAEAQAALLREGELQQQLNTMHTQLKGLKKAAATADKQRQKLSDEKAEADQKLEQLERQVPELRRKLEAAQKLATDRGHQLESVEKEKGGALAYAEAQAAAWEASLRRSQEECSRREQELSMAQARIETLQLESARQRAESRQAHSDLLLTQARLKEAESRSSGRLFMDGHWSAPDFLGRAGIGMNRGGSWSPECERSGSPDSVRVGELERRVVVLGVQLELERSRGRDEAEEAQHPDGEFRL